MSSSDHPASTRARLLETLILVVLIATEVGIILHLEAVQKMVAFIVEKACISSKPHS